MGLYFERFLLVAGAQDTGKSTQLRSMFMDRRLGTEGVIPKDANLKETYYLTNYKRLHLRLTSPHEMNESMKTFIGKIKDKTKAGRWCVASAMQIEAENKMPALPVIARNIYKIYKPECIRIAILSPDRHGINIENGNTLLKKLWAIPSCEAYFIDAQTRISNGMFLADTFFNH